MQDRRESVRDKVFLGGVAEINQAGSRMDCVVRNFSDEGWQDFAQRLHYLVGDANQREFYPQLKAKLEEMQKNGASKNVLFYISTSASLAPPKRRRRSPAIHAASRSSSCAGAWAAAP